MPIFFKPHYTITSKMASFLIRIEVAKLQIVNLPLTLTVLKSLRESARLYTIHYSTMIEGNDLSIDQIKEVIQHAGHFPGRERDEGEVKGYYAALELVEQYAMQKIPISEALIKKVHEVVMSHGSEKIKSIPYRDGQNVIRDGRTGRIVYLPPEAKDVSDLMYGLVDWVVNNEDPDIPCPIVAGIAHYQFATIHPYYDGNGRTARLLTTLILHAGGYDLKGLYSLEEYYARHLSAYYAAISVGNSHNYYEGRAESDITPWLEYFVGGMVVSFENVLKNMDKAHLRGEKDNSLLLRELDPKKRKALTLFQEFGTVTAQQIGHLFGFKSRTNAQLCTDWVKDGFLEVVDPSRKSRKYRLAKVYEKLIISE